MQYSITKIRDHDTRKPHQVVDIPEESIKVALTREHPAPDRSEPVARALCTGSAPRSHEAAYQDGGARVALQRSLAPHRLRATLDSGPGCHWNRDERIGAVARGTVCNLPAETRHQDPPAGPFGLEKSHHELQLVARGRVQQSAATSGQQPLPKRQSNKTAPSVYPAACGTCILSGILLGIMVAMGLGSWTQRVLCTTRL